MAQTRGLNKGQPDRMCAVIQPNRAPPIRWSETYRANQNPTKSEAMRARVLASGSRPTPAPMLSSRCLGSFVAGITQVTAGWDTIHFNKNCGQEWQSNSAVHGGSGLAEMTWKM